jgi:hypothetical protein
MSAVLRPACRFLTERKTGLAGGVAGAESVTSHWTSAYASGQLFSFSAAGMPIAGDATHAVVIAITTICCRNSFAACCR